MKTTREQDAREEDAPRCLTTTLYDLITALQDVVEPHEDSLVVGLVAGWLQTGRITVLNQATARRRLRRRASMALCRWGFHPPMMHPQPFPSGKRRLQGLTIHTAPPEVPTRTLEPLGQPALSF